MENMLEIKMNNDYKEIIIDIFRKFISICEQHNLRYFCCGGTAIGVVRHKGMIPWDDDIDVIMPREDYDKFLALMEIECPIGYEIVNPKTWKNYYLPFAKFSKCDTTILEHKNIPCVFGANIDIFPLDGAASNRLELEKEFKDFKLNSNKLRALGKNSINNLKAFFYHISKFQVRTAYNEIRYSFAKKQAQKAIWGKLEKILFSNSPEESNIVGNFCGMWGLREFCPKEWFDSYTFGDFEGFEVKLPIGYDKLLTQLYGDYMTPPPEEKRKSDHHLAFIDLDRRVSIDEIYRIIK